MDRKEFLRMGCCSFVFLSSLGSEPLAAQQPTCDDRLTFIQNWVSDLMGSIDSELDEATKIKVLSNCGRACFQRFQFKKDIAAKGKGSVEKLVEALKQNFETWHEGETVHVRYGAVNKYGCYCPAANYRPGKPNDIHCYCTRAMHQAIWEAALERPVRVDILQSVRRGDPTCHFLVHLA